LRRFRPNFCSERPDVREQDRAWHLLLWPRGCGNQRCPYQHDDPVAWVTEPIAGSYRCEEVLAAE
jgi:hypothetical protein